MALPSMLGRMPGHPAICTPEAGHDEQRTKQSQHLGSGPVASNEKYGKSWNIAWGEHGMAIWWERASKIAPELCSEAWALQEVQRRSETADPLSPLCSQFIF